MKTLNFSNKLSILCLGAHSDDIEIGCGATLLKLIRSKRVDNIDWVVFSGNEIRQTEAENSANEYLKGVDNHKFNIHSFKDGYFPDQHSEIKLEFEAIKKRINPDLVFTHYRQDRHQDHRVLSDLAWNTFRNHVIFEYEIPKWDGDIGKPNIYVEIDEEIMDQKSKFLMKHFTTQKQKHWFCEETFKSLARIRGLEIAETYAEAFYGRKISIF